MDNKKPLSYPTVAISPIHTLPNELLVRIFTLLCDSQSCNLGPGSGHPSYPTRFTHVCSRWRQLVIDSPVLWTHIDLSLYPGDLGDFYEIARAIVYLGRANQTPLDVHVLEWWLPRGLPKSSEFFELLDICLPRMRSLAYTETQRFGGDILYRCFKNAVPGKLKELTILLAPGITLKYLDEGKFLEYEQSVMPNATPGAHLDDLLHSVTTLRLSDFFPAWTSRAYHGLVELCLYIKNNFRQTVFISHLELLGVLSNSPKLRILDLNLQVRGSPGDDNDIVPIYLECLEVLRVGGVARSRLGSLLALFSPGSTPLSLSIGVVNDVPDELNAILYDSDIIAFFARSNVKNMWLSGTSYSDTLGLLSLAPHNRELTLGHFALSRPPDVLDRIKPNPTSPMGRIDTLYLLPSCKFELDGLWYMVQTHRVQTLLLHEECNIFSCGSPVPTRTLVIPDHLQGVRVKLFNAKQPHAWGFPALHDMGFYSRN